MSAYIKHSLPKEINWFVLGASIVCFALAAILASAALDTYHAEHAQRALLGGVALLIAATGVLAFIMSTGSKDLPLPAFMALVMMIVSGGWYAITGFMALVPSMLG